MGVKIDTTLTEELLLTSVFTLLKPPPRITNAEWADQYRYIAAGASAITGKFSTDVTPFMTAPNGPYSVLDDPRIKLMVSMKSAQIAWTETINNFIGRRIHIDPVGMIVMFPREKTAKDYEREKLVPMITATPELSDRINVSRSKASGNTWNFKHFPGGFLKLITSNSASEVKSTSAPILVVEEPDDSNDNIKGQGSTIKLAMERVKTYPDRKVIYGGTPTIKGFSQVEDAYNKSDQRVFLVPCNECGQSHELDFEYLLCHEFPNGKTHDIYGQYDPNTAFYACPNCGAVWNYHQKNHNVTQGRWEITAPDSDVAGFRFNELLSPFPGSHFADLKKKQLEAEHKLDMGDETLMIAFVNNSMGKAYEYRTAAPDEDVLREKALDYPELQAPDGVLAITAGIDVQHDRLAVILRGWGRDGNSWLLYWGELYGDVKQKGSAVWQSLDKLLFTPFQSVHSFRIPLSAASIDSGDGGTSEVIYDWVKGKKSAYVLAIKGDTDQIGKKEIYTAPTKRTVQQKKRTLAERHGVTVYMVGTARAKDEVHRRLKLTGSTDRMYYHAGVRQDYYSQLLSNVKIPSRYQRNVKVWSLRSGQRDEALDGEVYALHAARHCRLHLRTDKQWDDAEQSLRQSSLFTDQPVAETQQRRPSTFGGIDS